MVDHATRIWTVGGLVGEDGTWRAVKRRDITEREFEHLQSCIQLVGDLAGQRDYARLVAAVSRWTRTLGAAKSDLQGAGRLSSSSRHSLELDLQALVATADRLETLLAAKVSEVDENPLVVAFKETRHRIRATSPYLLIHELAPAALADGPKLVMTDGVIYFEGVRRQTAETIPVALLGEMFSLVVAYLGVFQDRFGKAATELEEAAADVDEGTPSLISYEIDPSNGSATRMSITSLPIPEIAALRQFFHLVARAAGSTDLAAASEVLKRAGPQNEVRIGDVDVSSGVVAGTANEGINALPSARFELDLGLLGSTPVDYWAPVRSMFSQGPFRRQLFAGAVQEAQVDGATTSLDCEGAVDLTEHNTRGMITANVQPGEVLQSLILQAGLSTDVLLTDEPPGEQSEEPFEVLVPIRGIEVDHPVEVGPMSIVPKPRGEEALKGFRLDGETAARLAAKFSEADSFGLAEVRTATLHEAEDGGTAAIETAMAWLTARERYGYARLPDGRARPFSRQEALKSARRGAVVLVRGRDSQRQWLRSLEAIAEPLPRSVDPTSPLLDPALPGDLSPTERQALLALQRATTEPIPESQLQALWEAIEFYVAGTKGPKLFAPSELDSLREQVSAHWNSAQRKKLRNTIDKLNEPPLGIRLGWRLERDGVPLSEDERDLLFTRLREARNAFVHGRRVCSSPTREELHRGMSLVARMLVYRISRRNGL
jgi:hypothetical protein